MGSNFLGKIGTGMPHILGFLERGSRNVGVPIFFVTTDKTHDFMPLRRAKSRLG